MKDDGPVAIVLRVAKCCSSVSRPKAAALAGAEATCNRCFVPDEPKAIRAEIPLLKRSAFCDRLWATRRYPWVDRVASAWLIQRFIDPEARFLWLENPEQYPAEALGFDFVGADFTHVDDKFTKNPPENFARLAIG